MSDNESERKPLSKLQQILAEGGRDKLSNSELGKACRQLIANAVNKNLLFSRFELVTADWNQGNLMDAISVGERSRSALWDQLERRGIASYREFLIVDLEKVFSLLELLQE